VTDEIFSGCVDIGNGMYVCKKDVNKEVPKEVDYGLLGDISKAVLITTVPAFTKEEATYIETSFASIIIGSIITGLSIAFGFYIYYLMGSIQIPIWLSDPVMEAIVMLIILMLIIALLGFIQYRVTKALTETKILERFATEKKNIGI